MKVTPIPVTKKNILSLLGQPHDIYILTDNRGNKEIPKNKGRLTLRGLSGTEIDKVIKRLENGEEVIALRVEV